MILSVCEDEIFLFGSLIFLLRITIIFIDFIKCINFRIFSSLLILTLFRYLRWWSQCCGLISWTSCYYILCCINMGFYRIPVTVRISLCFKFSSFAEYFHYPGHKWLFFRYVYLSHFQITRLLYTNYPTCVLVQVIEWSEMEVSTKKYPLVGWIIALLVSYDCLYSSSGMKYSGFTALFLKLLTLSICFFWIIFKDGHNLKFKINYN